jgi:xylan 1,4-beta-xylosidase
MTPLSGIVQYIKAHWDSDLFRKRITPSANLTHACLLLNGQRRPLMQYENPIIRGFNPDPSICRVGEDYYIVTSSFEYFPGLPVYHSRDLVNWTQISNCLQRAEEFPLLPVGDSGGVWAPSIRWHEGVFYVTATLEGYGNFIVTASDPAGTWTPPVWLPEIGGIDPSIYFEDGHAYYCTNDRLDAAHGAISLEEIDLTTGRVIGERKNIWTGFGASFLEAPHVYRIGEWYYLLAAEGGTFWTHMATIARSKELFGPYEGCPDNPILTNVCDGSWTVLCTGHGDLLEDHRGNWWMVHLSTRLARRTMGHLGRETFLTPVRWVDGWPVCGNHGKRAVLAEEGPLWAAQQPPQAFHADMHRTSWEPQWLFLRKMDMGRHQRLPGKMVLMPATQTLRDKTPTFAGLRPLDFACRMEADFTFDPLQPGDEAGFAIRLSSMFHITCTVGMGNLLTLTLQAEDICHTVAQRVIPEGPVTLIVVSDKEKYVFSFRDETGAETVLGQVSTRFLAIEIAGRCFTGTVWGLYAACAKPTAAHMTVNRFALLPQ